MLQYSDSSRGCIQGGHLKFDDDPIFNHLLFSFALLLSSSSSCRRSVLSTIAKTKRFTFGPLIAQFKVFLPQLCKKKMSWNESLPEAQNQKWLYIFSCFGSICPVEFPRFVLDSDADLENHGFCDPRGLRCMYFA